ncbi:MAG: VOC family protein [Muribaculaceae bacterium]|nr:VOC family protein [Muribaculaceae bacterium]
MKINKLHHIAVICSDYQRSLRFYTEVLGMEVLAEHYREERKSFKTDLALNGEYLIELFSFPDAPARPSYPEARGLRHIAFEVDNLDKALAELDTKGIRHEQIRTDEYTGKRFAFFEDPDHLPIEFYER